jgi:gliding motility-associated-like protein
MIRFKIIILFLISNLAFSQLSNKHWIPPLHANEDQVPNLILDHYLYLSTPEPIPFQVIVKNGLGIPITGSPFTISQNNPIRITIGLEQPSVMFLDRVDVGIIKSDKGLILEGSKDFYASFRVRSENHAEFLSSKGTTGAGKIFRLGSLPQTSFGGIRNFVSSFMATEDNTTVNLSDYDPNISFIVGNTTQFLPNQTFSLNKGQSVVVSGYANTNANLAGFVGALLTSDKPIVVNTGNLTGGLSLSTQGQDFNLDQIVPLEQVGTEYVIVKGSENDESEFPLIIAHSDNTEVFVNGNATPITTLNAGEYFLIPPSNYTGAPGNKNMYIRSSEKIFLYQIISGSDTSNATSGFYFIPPLSCFWQKSVDLIPSFNTIGNTVYDGNIVIATETGSTVSINNIVTSVIPITVLGNANWVSYKITGLIGNVKVESTGALAVGVYGYSGVAGYGGYFSGFGSIPNDSQSIVCTGSSVDLFDRIPGNPEVGGTWSYGSVDRIPNDGIFDPAVDPTGIYSYTFTKTCDGISRNYPILIDVSIQTGPNAGISNSNSFCINDSSIDLTTLLGSGITAGGNWSFNSAARANGSFNPATDLSGEYKYTIPASGVCQEVSATISVTVNANPSIVPISDYEECDNNLVDNDDANGETFFTLTNKNSEILNGQTGINVTYHDLQSDAIAGLNPITSIHTANRIIYVRLTNTSTNCFATTSFNLVLNPLPISNAIVSLKQCDDDTDANTNFNLTDANGLISNNTSLLFTYHNSETGAINNTDLVTNALNFNASNNDVVWSRIETTNGCYRTARVDLIVSTTQIPTSFNPLPLEECDDYVDVTNLANDGFDNFDIESAFTQLIKNLFPVGQQPFLEITYYVTFNDALLIVNPIINPTDYKNSRANTQTIWARVDSSLNSDSGCQGIKELQLIVNPLPEIDLGVNFTLCVDPITGLGSKIVDARPSNSGSFSYNWTPTNLNVDSLGNENAQFNITRGGTYSVLVTNTVSGCEVTDTIVTDFSSEPETFIADVVTPAFSTGLTTIVCNATGGFGQYEYSLNLIDWQISNTFTDLPNGNYTAYVRDIQGCGIMFVENLFAITFPNFFTPNGDGFNDTWGITGLDTSYAAIITIYDRYGKLLRRIDPTQGWDGIFNGEELPSTDYWFKIEYTEDGSRKEFKSHFSLKR